VKHQAAFSYAFYDITMVQILHQETVGQVNSCHVFELSCNHRPTAPSATSFAAFYSVVALPRSYGMSGNFDLEPE
jgi:hypothetical protein